MSVLGPSPTRATFAPVADPRVHVTTTTTRSHARLSALTRLRQWWRRLWLSPEAQAILDAHGAELDRALLYGERDVTRDGHAVEGSRGR